MGRNLLFTVFFLILYLYVYSGVIRREERYLTKHCGEKYQSYIQDVPRIFPGRFNLREVLKETKLLLALKNLEHLTVSGIAVFLAFVMIKLIVNQ